MRVSVEPSRLAPTVISPICRYQEQCSKVAASRKSQYFSLEPLSSLLVQFFNLPVCASVFLACALLQLARVQRPRPLYRMNQMQHPVSPSVIFSVVWQAND